MKTRRRTDLEHIADAEEHLLVLQQHLTRGGLDDAMVRDAVSHRLEVAIDAISRLTPGLLDDVAPEYWPKIVGMRNLLAHQYADLDQEILQNTIDNRLPDLVKLISQLRNAASRAES